jgi:hypothetical protein
VAAVFAVLVAALPLAGAQAAPSDPAASAFERFQALAGTWRAESTRGWTEQVTFEVIAVGSVVMSTTTFRDAPDNKMVTMYSLDNGDLVTTHYCEARNQPHLMATQIDDDARTVEFTFQRGGNMVSRDQGHMDRAVFRFIDENEFTSRWTWYQDGAEDWMEEIHYQRLEEAGDVIE